MKLHIIYIIGSFLMSAACGYIFTPIILRFCKKKGLYDLPDGRKIHHQAIPRLGGISFLPCMLLASLIVLVASDIYLSTHQVSLSLWSICFFCSLAIIYGVGFIDDLVGLGAKTKFVAQILAGTLLPLSGLWVNNLYGFFGVHEIPFGVGAPLTVFAIIFTCNAINLIDGIDGLSAGLSLFALSGFLFCFMREGLWLYSILIAGLMGALIPFLYYNIWGKAEKGQKIFMGDSGSLTLGYILGFLFVKYTMDNPNVAPFHSDAMLLAYTMLLVPVTDVLRVTLVRMRHRARVFHADKNHLHHKLMRAGMNQHQTLITILALAVFFTIFNLLIWPVTNFTITILADLAVWAIFHMIVNRAILKRGELIYQPNNETQPA